MNTVVLTVPKPTNITVIENVSSEHYYGVCCGNTEKGFICCDSFRTGTWRARACHSVTVANGWSISYKLTLQECIEALIENDYKVYEFETYQELFQWLAK